ncbi:MAG TPA: glutamine amidotransferase [Marmoricola sp.]|nr:glutamine amidotransferase [Marmoricola sp.]
MPDLAVVVIYPELLGLYADRGNALAYRFRAGLRGLSTEIVDVAPGEAVPADADFYVLGGAEDASMTAVLPLLREQRGLVRAIERGAPMLAVCGGFQLLCRSFAGPHDEVVEGLGHLCADSRHLPGPRAVGDLTLVSPSLGELQGFENHRGDARLGAGLRPLGSVLYGVGNGHDGAEGAVQGSLVGTYLHGPVLVRNPALADFFLARSVGRALPSVRDDLVERYRAERRRETAGRHHAARRAPRSVLADHLLDREAGQHR